MKKLILLLFFFSTFLNAQVKIIVLDSITQKPIPYVGVCNNENENSYSTNENGKLKTDKLKLESSLTFFTSSYEKKEIKVKNCNKSIFLQPKLENNIQSNSLLKNEETYLINDDTKFSFENIYMLPESKNRIIATYIPYSDEVIKTPYLSKVEFGIKIADFKSIYKIRFFEADENQMPATELCNKEIIATAKKTTSFYGGYDHVTDENGSIDVSNYKIKFPKNGIFVAIEIINLKLNIPRLGR